MSAVSGLGEGPARVRSPLPRPLAGSLPTRSPDPGPRPLDCSHCGAAGSVWDGFCEVCYAEPVGAADLPPAAPGADSRTYRMTDVIAEIRAIRALALKEGAEGNLRLAFEQLEELLRNLRRQFISDVIVGHPSATP